MEIALVLFVIAAIFVVRAIKVVPQQNSWVVERLGKYHSSLTPGLNFLIPFVDKVAYKHSLKEIPLDVFVEVAGIVEYRFGSDDPDINGFGLALNGGIGARYYF